MLWWPRAQRLLYGGCQLAVGDGELYGQRLRPITQSHAAPRLAMRGALLLQLVLQVLRHTRPPTSLQVRQHLISLCINLLATRKSI